MLASLPGWALLVVALASGVDAAERPVILFELGARRNATTIAEPIAMLRNGRLEEVPIVFSIAASAEHDRARRTNHALTITAFPVDAHLQALAAGRAVGQVRITGHYDEDGVHTGGCAWFSIPVDAIGELVLPHDKPMLAINDAGRVDTGFAPRAPSADMGRLLDRTARALFRKRGVPAAIRKRMTREHAAEYGRRADGKAMLVANFRIETNEEQRGAIDGLHALFVVLERANGKWLLTHHAYRFGTDSHMESEYAIDLIDIDGDRRPEIVTRIVQYESWYFAVHRKRASKWERALSGGGGGC